MSAHTRERAHAPWWLRDLFAAVMADYGAPDWWERLATWDAREALPAELQATWARWSAQERLQWLTGQLWTCVDILPWELCTRLGLPPGSTYTRAARLVRQAARAPRTEA